MLSAKKSTVIRYDAADPRLGRHVEHDVRSVNFAFMNRLAKPKYVNTDWGSQADPLDQGDVGSCTCTSLCQWMNTDFALGPLYNAGKVRQGQFFTQDDALKLYKAATRLDPIPGFYPEEDTGSTGNAAAKAGRAAGYLTGYSWLFSFKSLQAAIEQTPLLVGTLWTEAMFEPQDGLVKVGPLINSNISGGHEYLMVGVDYAKEVFKFRQSWGEWDGAREGGYFDISFMDFARLLDADGDVTVPKIA